MKFDDKKIDQTIGNDLFRNNSLKDYECLKCENLDQDKMTEKQNQDLQSNIKVPQQASLKLRKKGAQWTADQKNGGQVKKSKKVRMKQYELDKENQDSPALSKVQSNICLAPKSQYDQKLNLRQLPRMPSCGSNVQSDKLQQTGFPLAKRVQFQEQRSEIRRQKLTTSDQVCIQFEQFYSKLSLRKIKEQQQPKQSFLQFICGLLRLRRKRVHNKVQQRLLCLNRMKVSGSKQQLSMLMYVFERLTCEQGLLESKDWMKIGFQSEKPLKQLQNIGVLTLLQWCCFIAAHYQKSLRIFNLCIELNCSLFHFHRLATRLFCEQIQSFLLTAHQWDQYQQFYNTLILLGITSIQAQSKQSIDNIEKFMINALGKSAKNLKQGSIAKGNKPQIK